MIDTVLLDLDDTILDFHKSEAFALKKTLEELGIEPLSSTIERYSESYLVTIADKICSSYETIYKVPYVAIYN